MNGSRVVGLWDEGENGGEEGEGRMMSSSKRWWDDRIHVCRHRVKQGLRVEVGIGVAPWCVWRQRGGVVHTVCFTKIEWWWRGLGRERAKRVHCDVQVDELVAKGGVNGPKAK